MTSEEFVKEFYLLNKALIEGAFTVFSGWKVSSMIAELKLDDKTTLQLKNIMSTLLTDAFYTILLGLDGEVQIGVKQELYKIYDEDGNELTGGEIEAYAYEYFNDNNRNE